MMTIMTPTTTTQKEIDTHNFIHLNLHKIEQQKDKN